MYIKIVPIAILCCFFRISSPAQNDSETVAKDTTHIVLKAAYKVAKTTPNYRDKNCVQFVTAVVRELCPDMTPLTKERIFINKLDGNGKITKKIIENDVRSHGVEYALIQAGLGDKVERKDIRSGDFVQYWYKNKPGRKPDYIGHSAIIHSVNEDGTYNIYGSHKGTNGPAVLRNMKDKEFMYFVRWKGGEDRSEEPKESTPEESPKE